jgi:hypothetical protein
MRDALFMVGLIITFVAELINGIQIIVHPDDSGAVNSIVVLVVICFLIGIDRAWELVGGPSIGISHEVAALVRGNERGADNPADKESPP